MKNVINLNNLSGLPAEFLAELDRFRNLFLNDMFLDSLLENRSILSIVRAIDTYCMDNQLIGFHYTRAFEHEISSSGLVCRTGLEIRNAFLDNHISAFSEGEIANIKKTWDNHFDLSQQKSRDARLYFNFTTTALNNGGADPLLSSYGGEQVYMPFNEIQLIDKKLKSIGTPMIIKCMLDPNHLNTFWEFPWGRIAVSTYHCQVNRDAIRNDQDGYQFVNVSAENIEILHFDTKIDYDNI